MALLFYCHIADDNKTVDISPQGTSFSGSLDWTKCRVASSAGKAHKNPKQKKPANLHRRAFQVWFIYILGSLVYRV